MKVVSAYLLAVLGGKSSPSEADIKAILSAVGAEADSANIQKLIGELKGKDVAEVIKAGTEKLAKVSAAAPAAAAPAAAAGGAAPAAGKEAAKKKEEKVEEEEEDFGMDLFG